MRLNLSACPPFSLWAVVNSHGWVQLPPFSTDNRAEALVRVERLESGRVVDLVIQEAAGGVTVKVREQLSGAEREEVSRKVWWMLGLGEALDSFYAVVREEPKMAHVEPKAMGRILRSPTAFEDLVKTLLTTNVSWEGTIRMTEALVSHFGDPLSTNPSRNAFPLAHQLAQRSEKDLRDIGLGYRAPFLLDLARCVSEGKLDLEGFKNGRNGHQPVEMVHQTLLELKGIGEYGAAMFMMLLGHYDYLPVDAWACKLVSHEWYGDQEVSKQEVLGAFEQWGQWKGLVYWFWGWANEEEAL